MKKNGFKKLEEIQNARYYRAINMINELAKLNIHITMTQVEGLANKGTIGRPHIARAMVENGYISHIKDAFELYIGKGKPAYVERYKLSCQEAIDMIKALNGVPVLAHPGIIGNKSIIGVVLNMGIEGIEVYHSKHDDETIRNLLQIAKARNLIMTGGSDCHGVFINNEPILGNIWVDYSQVQKLKDKILLY